MNVRPLHVPCTRCRSPRGYFVKLPDVACARYRLDCFRGHFLAFFDTPEEAAMLFQCHPKKGGKE